MNSGNRRARAIAAALLAAGLAKAGDESVTTVAASSAPTAAVQPQSQDDEIARLKAQLAAQQKQLETLQHMMQDQQQLLEKAVNASGTAQQPAHPNLGNVASLTPVMPVPAAAIPAIPSPAPQKTATASVANPCEANFEAGNAVPPYLRLGSVCIVPIGFMDLTGLWRSSAAGSSITTNFASIPFNNIQQAHNSEYRFSPQNSRLGFRLDGDWKGAHFIGYNEFDFFGTSGAFNLGITNGAFVPRLRLFWVDVRRDKWEFLAGQSWSMLTPNRRGISPFPGDLFYSQVVDVNYLIGLTWTRQPGVRVLYHPNDKITLGLSAENPNQQIGGSAGAPVVVLPAALTSLAGVQLDNGTTAPLSTPNLTPDFIFKAAFDPSSRAHVEFAGIVRNFKIWNPNTNTHFGKTGGGVTWGINVEALKNFRLISNGYWSDGGGRYLFGTIPDLILRANGGVSPIHAGGTTDGFEWTLNNTLLYAYFGGAFAGRNVAVDTNGSLVGYGYRGSSNSNNRVMEEVTLGINQTIWKSPRYGAINVMPQWEYAWRAPWFVALGAPKAAKDNTVYVNIRYTLPGSMPNF